MFVSNVAKFARRVGSLRRIGLGAPRRPFRPAFATVFVSDHQDVTSNFLYH